jgi:hypothetical protein
VKNEGSEMWRMLELLGESEAAGGKRGCWGKARLLGESEAAGDLACHISWLPPRLPMAPQKQSRKMSENECLAKKSSTCPMKEDV